MRRGWGQRWVWAAAAGVGLVMWPFASAAWEIEEPNGLWVWRLAFIGMLSFLASRWYHQRQEELKFEDACARLYLAESGTGWVAWPREDGMAWRHAERVAHGDTPQGALKAWSVMHG